MSPTANTAGVARMSHLSSESQSLKSVPNLTATRRDFSSVPPNSSCVVFCVAPSPPALRWGARLPGCVCGCRFQVVTGRRWQEIGGCGERGVGALSSSTPFLLAGSQVGRGRILLKAEGRSVHGTFLQSCGCKRAVRECQELSSPLAFRVRDRNGSPHCQSRGPTLSLVVALNSATSSHDPSLH